MISPLVTLLALAIRANDATAPSDDELFADPRLEASKLARDSMRSRQRPTSFPAAISS